MIEQFKGQTFRQVDYRTWQMRIDDTWKYDIVHNRHGWYIAAGADCPSERDYHKTRQGAFAQLINWCNLEPPTQPAKTAVPAIGDTVKLPDGRIGTIEEIKHAVRNLYYYHIRIDGSLYSLTRSQFKMVSEPKSAPAKSVGARLVVRDLPKSGAVGRSDAPKSSATGKPVSIAITADKQPVLQPVSFGGSLDTELGLAESLNLLNNLQLASGGAWLDAQYETPEGV